MKNSTGTGENDSFCGFTFMGIFMVHLQLLWTEDVNNNITGCYTTRFLQLAVYCGSIYMTRSSGMRQM